MNNATLQQVYQQIKDGGVLTLSGDLGSGKTTFVQKLAKLLKIKDFTVKSPTYNYIRQYSVSDHQSLYHLDLYRLEEIDYDLLHEIEELYQTKTDIIIIEWPQRLGNYKPENSLDLEIIYHTANHREIKILTPH